MAPPGTVARTASAWAPGASGPVCTDAPQGVHWPLSRLHSGPAVPAVQTLKAAVGPVRATAAGAGAGGIDTTGGVPSTLPAASAARTARSWPPGTVSGLAHGAQAPPSRWHSKRASGSVDENVTAANGWTADGRIAIALVSGAAVSIVHVRTG